MQKFVLPDLFVHCPFEGGNFNEHFVKASEESYVWVSSFDVIAERKRQFYRESGSEMLAAKAYYYTEYEEFRTICDYINLLFILDEISDDQGGADARITMDTFLNVLRDPKWDNGSKLSAFCRTFQKRLSSSAGPACYRRFVSLCEDYINAVVIEAGVREKGEVWSLDSFMPHRRANSAVPLCFGLFDYGWRIDLPDEVYEHPVFKRMRVAAIDMVCWSNDLYSYNMEQAMGHTTNNILTVLMKQESLDLQGAANYVGEHFGNLMETYLASKASLPSFGPEIDGMLAKHMKSMEGWIVGNLEWSFETTRYFGPNVKEVKMTRVVTLNPKKVRL